MSAHDFDSVIREGIDIVYRADLKTTEHRLKTIAVKDRGMSPDVLKKAKAFFVPNNDYMVTFFGDRVLDTEFDCYDSLGNCYWLGYMVMPIYNVVDEIVGLVGYNPINKIKAKEEEFWSLSYYRHSGSILMDKKKFLFGLPSLLQRAIKEGYIILTDGVFDTLHGEGKGLVTGALLGSYFGKEIIAILKFIPKVYVSVDDDEAGFKLHSRLKQYIPNIRAIKHNVGKDLDDILKSEYSEDFLEKFRLNLKSNINNDFIYRRDFYASRDKQKL